MNNIVEDKELMAMCGTYCGVCTWKDKINCPGCLASKGDMIYGECDKAKCCIQKGFKHCGLCPEMPCQKLLDLFKDPDHGDKGARLYNLKNWSKGNNIFKKLR